MLLVVYVDIEKFRDGLIFSKRGSELTIKGYVEDVIKFKIWLEKNNLITDKDEPTKDHVRDYIISMSKNGLDPGTINRHFYAIKKYFLYQERANELDLVSETYLPSIDHKEAPYLTNDQIKAILETCDKLIMSTNGKRRMFHVRNKILIYVLYLSGLRRAEVINLRESDIDFENKLLHVSRVKRRKNSKAGILPLNDIDLRILRVWLRLKPRSEWLFPGQNPSTHISGSSVWYSLSYVGDAAGIHLYPHEVRHSTITNMLLSGVSMSDAGAFAGHANIDTTRNAYAHHLNPDYIKRNMTKFRDNLMESDDKGEEK